MRHDEPTMNTSGDDMSSKITRLAHQLFDQGLCDDDVRVVECHLGRFPRGMVAVGARNQFGEPLVVITRPQLEDGTPFPTVCYLTHPDLTKAVSRLEAAGQMKQYNQLLQDDEVVLKQYHQAHEEYLAFRDAIAQTLGDSQEHIASMSAGGMPERVKCLHALVAQSLVMGRGINPIGDLALETIIDDLPFTLMYGTDIVAAAHQDSTPNATENAAVASTTQSTAATRAITVAAFDCGTNSIRMKIARVDEHGMHDIVPRMLHVVRLGQGVDQNRRFSDQALQRVFTAADEFGEVLANHQVDIARFVATSATRDATNREAFERYMQQTLSVTPEVISGEEEAKLSFLAATTFLPKALEDQGVDAPYLVVDLGGGSTELVLGVNAQITARYSMNIGSVRMSERHLHHDPPTREEIEAAIADIDEHIDEAARYVPLGQVGSIVGVSGTVTTLAAIELGLTTYDHSAVDGAIFDIDEALSVNESILSMTYEQRSEYKTIHPGRIDVIGAGALIWSRVLTNVRQAVEQEQHRSMRLFVTSEHGLLDGIVLDCAQRYLQRR